MSRGSERGEKGTPDSRESIWSCGNQVSLNLSDWRQKSLGRLGKEGSQGSLKSGSLRSKGSLESEGTWGPRGALGVRGAW